MKINKKIILSFLVFVSLISIVFIFASLRNPALEIYTEPKESTILIDGKKAGVGKVKTRIKKGDHEIQVIMDGYRPYLQEININDNTTQNITLIPISEGVVDQTPKLLNVPAFSVDLFQPISEGVVVAINKINSYLVKIDKTGVSTLFSKPVHTFSFENPYVALIEKENLNKITIINIVDGQTKTFDATSLSPVISVSVSSDSKNVYILGKYNPTTRISTLYSSLIDNFSPSQISSFSADLVQALPNNKILTSLSADAADLNKISVYDLANTKALYQTKGSGHIVSPLKQHILVYFSNRIEIFSLFSSESKKFPFSYDNQKVFWRDNDTIGVLTNKFPGVTISLIDVNTKSQTSNIEIPQLDQLSVRFILGCFNNTLYALDTEGKTWSITLPSFES